MDLAMADMFSAVLKVLRRLGQSTGLRRSQVTKEVQQARTKAEEAKGEFEQDDGRMPCHGDSHYEKTLYIHRHIYVSYRAHKMRTADFKYDPHVFLLAESSSCSLQGNFW